MAIVRWDPFQEMVSVRDAMDRLFQESFVRPTTRLLTREGGLAMDIYDTDNEVVVKASLPGIKPEDVDITMTGDMLTIRGESKAEENIKQENYYLQERRYGSFSRSVTIPMPVQADKAEAKFEHGVLTLTLPKAKRSSPKASRSGAERVPSNT
ncbi:MAG: Hsp20/alpha crystallin family protein [Dehalococcoidia bacterium]|nr:Hsp20/alpha crystallin family protein [Dehalococcoidia bacterium]